jgi:anti-sigma regulatory factor (Ser/Thr protein kinase)/predicted N-acetyltransferase YhbS
MKSPMPRFLAAHLTVPANKRFLHMIQHYVRDLGTTAGLAGNEILGLELAAEEAFMNVVERAYPDGTTGDVFLEGKIERTELVLSIRDEGEPPDVLKDSPATDYGSEEAEEAAPRRIRFRLIRHSVDEVHFENLGSRGKALRLVKRLPHIIEVEPECSVRETETAPPQNYEIRPTGPEDISQIPRLFWKSYGYTYKKNVKFYQSENLLHLVESGRALSYVAMAENGEVVGHVGLLIGEQFLAGEMAWLVVAPAHRGRGLMEALSNAVEKRVVELKLRGVSWITYTGHTITQRECIRLGGKPCGLELSSYPRVLFKSLVDEEGRPQRESVLYFFKHLSPPPQAVVHVPPHHKQMVLRIYENLEQSCTPGDAEAVHCTGECHVHLDKATLEGVIKVVSADKSLWPEVLRATKDLFAYAGTAVVYLDLPLAQPASVALCELAEREGYFFAGIRLMEAVDGDNLRLQWIASPLDTTGMRIYPGFGEELSDYVMSRMAAARTLSSGIKHP